MHSVIQEASRVRDAPLSNTLEAYYVAPLVPIMGAAPRSVLELVRRSSCRNNAESSLPLSFLSSLATDFEKPMEDNGLELRRIVLHTPPSKGLSSRAALLHRRRQSKATVEALAAVAASKTLQRQQQRQHHLSASSSRSHACSVLSLEALQSTYPRSDSSTSVEAAPSRKMAKVTSPCAKPSATLPTEAQPGVQSDDKKSSTRLTWRLRRRSETPTNPWPLSSLLDRKRDPLAVLRHLGASTFNDAPLHTFLPSLDLRRPSTHSSTGPNNTATESYARETPVAAATAEQSRWPNARDSDRRRRRGSWQRRDAVAVHVGDVEARTFRVQVLPGEASPVQAVVDACCGCPWDGTEFLLMPLEDDPRVPLDTVVPPHLTKDLARLCPHDEDSDTPGGRQTTSFSSGRESQIGLDLPGVPITFLRSVNSFRTPSIAAEVGGQADEQRPLSSNSVTAAAVGARTITDSSAFVRAMGGFAGDAESVKSMVPCWKRFSTTAALYLALGDAGCCDTACFPYPAVQLCTWGDLVAQQQTRVEMMASCSAAAIHRLQAAQCEKRRESVPVAVMFPTTLKGVMRRPLSLTTQPFSDAEVFQLFYLQLIFRAYFDVRFPTLGFRRPGQAEWHLSSNFIAVRSSGNHCVAFEHPRDSSVWIRFPTRTRLLTLLCLKEAIVPLYATPSELQESAVQPLYGAGDALPCLGALGHAVAQWAATVEVTSPASAMAALTTLFDKVGKRYCSTRAEMWGSSVAPRTGDHSISTKAPLLFRCSVASVGAALNRHGSTLARFFVLPEKRGALVASTGMITDTADLLHDDEGTSSELLMTQPGTTRCTHVPCIRSEENGTSLVLPSTVLAPRQFVLGDAMSSLSTPIVARRSSGVTDAFVSTTGTNSTVNQSHTNVYASTFDVVHLSALQMSDEGAALDTSKLLCSSPLAALDATAGGTMGSFSYLVAVPSSTKKESKNMHLELESNPLLNASEDVLKAEDSHALSDNTQSEREETEENASAIAPVQSISFVGAFSPFTKQASLVSRWHCYMQSGNCAIFDGSTAEIKLFEFLGRGGSGFVYRGTYGSRQLPVAVKVLIIPDGMSHERYVRESLTDVAFYVLANQLNDYGISYNGRAHDFIISSVVPEGLPASVAAEARRGGDPASTKLCYFVTDLMDGTVGRFLDADDDDFDPMYDQLVNSPLQEGELFQFLFNQIVFKALFNWRVLDFMLNNQLRGDNIGYRYISLPPDRAAHLREHPEEAAALSLARQYYGGLLFAFQFSPEDNVKYLRFPATQENGNGSDGDTAGGIITEEETPPRFICMIDVGQGIQPSIAELVRRGLVGETVVDSCIQDDGFGRFWPLDELYCRYVDVKGPFSKEVVAWGSKVRINSQEDAFHALQELILLYYPIYGVETPREEELRTYLCFSWTPESVKELQKGYVYQGI
ncbi:hypothetical protein ABL78_6116 [Leptomonas seymouri]|uniref:Protein kinase domain-containing protein n=1 Tax=Leptomonas seymouri TaxID=5684 RepID=A0A0N1HVW3_LEPSE|nr:hypothetical protein ABL78_6116 [Leptomonas seymouri]|eukprot:KPI84832.1 hypothetical protein ABL78_6116 [Leptomonas seymouri]